VEEKAEGGTVASKECACFAISGSKNISLLVEFKLASVDDSNGDGAAGQGECGLWKRVEEE